MPTAVTMGIEPEPFKILCIPESFVADFPSLAMEYHASRLLQPDLLRLFEGEIALAGSSQNGFVLRKHAVSTALLDHVSHELRQEQD